MVDLDELKGLLGKATAGWAGAMVSAFALRAERQPLYTPERHEADADKAVALEVANALPKLRDLISEVEALQAERLDHLGMMADRDEQIEKLRGALGIVESWLDRHATHVGNCEGGNRCTCGLTRVRYDARTALEAGR